MNKKHLILIVLGILVGFGASFYFKNKSTMSEEERFRANVQEEVQHAMPPDCTEEVKRFCSQATLDKIRGCLKDLELHLSEKCRAAIK